MKKIDKIFQIIENCFFYTVMILFTIILVINVARFL